MALKEMKTKVKETANEVKDFVVDNKGLLIMYGVIGAAAVGSIAYGRHDSKKWQALWRKAKDQLDSGEITDFGPYKVCKFFEPTGEFIGQLPMAAPTVERFLELK